MYQQKSDKKRDIQYLPWSDVADRVRALDPPLAKVIDAIPYDKQPYFYLLKYRFGDKILDYGKLNVPTNDDKLISVYSPNIDPDIKKNLSYCPIPTSLVLSKCAEVYYEPLKRVVPLNVISKGQMFGLWESFDPTASSYVDQLIWNISAGTRSVCALPSITDTNAHKRLSKQLGIKPYPPKTLYDHWSTFVEITRSQKIKDDWCCEILVFTGDCFDESKLQFRDLQHFLIKKAWAQSIHWRNKAYIDLIWESYWLSINERKIKPKLHLAQTLQHLVTLSLGALPAFKPIRDDMCGPFSKIQEVYAEVYGLDSLPIIMSPCHTKENSFIYYSLQWPTLLEFYPAPGETHSLMDDLRHIKQLIDIFQDRISHDNSPLTPIMKEIKFDYFHTAHDNYGEVNSSTLVCKDDKYMSYYKQNYSPDKFPSSSAFLKGCIRISNSIDSTSI